MVFHQADKCSAPVVNADGLVGGDVFGKLRALAAFEHGYGAVVQFDFGEVPH